jgi:uncharacterized membrane protein
VTSGASGSKRLGSAHLDLLVEGVLTAGLLASAALLIDGLARGDQSALHLGFVLLVGTPIARVVVVTLGLLFERDWLFALVSFWVLVVLGSSAWVAYHG